MNNLVEIQNSSVVYGTSSIMANLIGGMPEHIPGQAEGIIIEKEHEVVFNASDFRYVIGSKTDQRETDR